MLEIGCSLRGAWACVTGVCRGGRYGRRAGAGVASIGLRCVGRATEFAR